MTAPTSSSTPTLSLVVATLGRTWQVERLFASLAAQVGVAFDVVVVDQNDDDRLLPVVQQHWPFPVRHLRTDGERGASRARNRGWRACFGDVLLFPDDDCWYPPDFLADALARMAATGCAVLSGRPTDESGRTINGRFEATAQRIDATNVWTTAIEWIVFFERRVLDAVGGFDEGVGIGAATPWQSSEIQDILLRAEESGADCRYDPDVIGHHEEMVVGRPDAALLRKARGYARGMGYVLAAHGYSPWRRASWVIRPLGGAALSFARGRWHMVPYYTQVAIGRMEGGLRRTLPRG